ncbi:MAG: SbcC/MukB-like Walker B domain-containing protein, partial [Dehalococcoidales bacterium]
MLAQIETIVKEKESRLSGLRQEKETLEKKQAQLDQLVSNIKDSKRSLEMLAEQVSQHHSRLKEYEELIAQRTAIEEGYSQFIETKRLNDELDQKFRQEANLKERKHHLEMTIAQASQELLKEHTLAQSKINELEASAQKLPQLKNQLQQIQSQLVHLTEQEERLRQQKQASQELQTLVNYLESNRTQLEKEIKAIGDKIELLSTQTEAKCPLCERELEIDGLNLIESKYTADRQGKVDSLKSMHVELAQKRTELDSTGKEISQIEAQLNQDKISVQSKAGILRNEITEAEGADKQLTEERAKLAGVELHLAKQDFASIEQEALMELESELSKLDYDSERHEQVRGQLSDLEKYENPKRKLEEANSLIDQERAAASRAETAAQELRLSLEADNQKTQDLTIELGPLPRLVSDIAQAETEQQALAAQQKQAQETLGSVKAKLQRLTELEKKKKEKEGLLVQTSNQESIYKELAKAFGKGGIQALLIEMALPEIEVEANRLLSRMTDNRMHVKFETQRESKKGDVIETLDINISDELGMRNYEMFSGGEAFRINFAIRIALSKLLARRAGAPLPTLIIDEGFGTQDSTGIEKLKEAINSIQDDFEKLLVITHIEELRDAFPTRIDVTKTAEGSTLSVN